MVCPSTRFTYSYTGGNTIKPSPGPVYASSAYLVRARYNSVLVICEANVWIILPLIFHADVHCPTFVFVLLVFEARAYVKFSQVKILNWQNFLDTLNVSPAFFLPGGNKSHHVLHHMQLFYIFSQPGLNLSSCL